MKSRDKVINRNAAFKTVLGMLVLSGAAFAQDFEIQIQDGFSGSPATGLNGRAPDVRTGLETWAAPEGYKADGSYSAAANGSAWLPITIEAGKTYKISAEVSIHSAASATYWAGIGFGTDSLLTASALTQATRGAAALALRHDGKITAYVNGGTQAGSDLADNGDTVSLALVLKTHADGTPWTAEYYVGETLRWTHEVAANPAITRVAVGNGGAGANEGGFKNFRLMSDRGKAGGLQVQIISKKMIPRINTEHERNRAMVAKIDGALTPVETLAALEEGWRNPPATYRPHTRWWWPGNAVTKEGITWQLEQMKEQGHGGVELMYFRWIYDKGNIQVDSPELIEMVKHVVDECRRLGMYTGLPLGPGWNHGSSQTPEEEKSQALVYSEADVEGGLVAQTLPLPTHPSYATIRPKLFEALVAVALRGDGSPDPSRRVDLTDSVSGSREWAGKPALTVEAELPPGRWRLVAFWNCTTGQKCAAENFEPRTWIIDHLSNRAAKNHANYLGGKYLRAFGADFGQTVDSIFGDSYELSQDFTLWTTGLLERFKKEKGYDLRPYLPLMMYDGAPETPYIRHDIGRFLHQLGMEGVTAGLSDWCAEAGVHMRQQPHYRMTTDIIAASGVFQRPETENTKFSFDPVFWHKLTTSGAWLYPSKEKKWVSCEAFTFINLKYRTSMEEIKRASDLFLRDGVTQFYNHGYFYTPEMEIAPSRDQVVMCRISHVNTWWPWYRGLADYQARAAFLSRQGRAEADVLVYAPYATLWSERSEYPAKHVRDLPFGHLPKTLIANGYDFDFVNDDLLLNHAEIQDGKLVINGYDYTVLILPRALCLAPETLEKIERFALAGGTVFALSTLPAYSDGWKNHEARDTQLAAVRDRLFNTAGGEKAVGQGRTWFMPDCDGFEYLKVNNASTVEPAPTPPLSPAYAAFIAALRSRLTPDFEMADKAQSDGLTFRRTVVGDVDCWFITNLQPHPRKTRITLKTKSKEPQIWDAMDESIRGAESFDFAPDGRVMLDVDLEPWESKFVLLTPSGSVELPPARERIALSDRHVSPVDGSWEVSFRGLGNLTADLTMNTLKDWRDLPGLKHFSGTATYQTDFNLQPEIINRQSAIVLDLGEVCDVATVIINGEEAGRVWMPPYRVDISGQVRPGANTLKVVVANRLWNHTSGLKEPKPIPEHLHAHYGSTWRADYAGWDSTINQIKRMGGDLFPSGLLGPVRVELKK